MSAQTRQNALFPVIGTGTERIAIMERLAAFAEKAFYGFLKVVLVVAVVGIVGAVVFYALWVDTVESHELGYIYNRWTGRITRVAHPGYVITHPFVSTVHTIDLRPMQVCINANNRTLNCKLVQFNPRGLDAFLAMHGRDDYDLQRLNGILLSYAYEGSGRTYPFLTIVSQLEATGAALPGTTVDAGVTADR